MSVIAVVALMCLGQEAENPTLLAEAPAGWRFERIEMPLPFAPELDYSGFEELRFAPGMFEPDSDMYFSYALALRMDGDHEVDEAFATRFFEAYFRGLCRAVGEGNDIEIDVEAIDARFEVRGDELVGEVDIFDTFTTGDAVTLSVDLAVVPGPGMTEVFGALSPKPRDTEVWNELRAMKATWRDARPEPAFFNHLFVIPDQATYDALAGSAFLREQFCVSEERETVRADMTYSGVYFYGRRTYFEFLPPDAAGLPGGSSGLAFGFERAGATARVAPMLEESGFSTFVGPVSRAHPDDAQRQAPWFQIMGVQRASQESKLDLFSMEYDPGFLDGWAKAESRTGTGISRGAVLERYAQHLGQTERRTSGPFVDVVEIHLALDAAERERFLGVCRVLGYRIEDGESGATCVGPQVRYVVTSSDAPGGIRAFVMELRAPLEREPMELGNATFRFEGKRATLSFGE